MFINEPIWQVESSHMNNISRSLIQAGHKPSTGKEQADKSATGKALLNALHRS